MGMYRCKTEAVHIDLSGQTGEGRGQLSFIGTSFSKNRCDAGGAGAGSEAEQARANELPHSISKGHIALAEARRYIIQFDLHTPRTPILSLCTQPKSSALLPDSRQSTMRFAIGATALLAAAFVRADDEASSSSAADVESSTSSIAKPTFTVSI